MYPFLPYCSAKLMAMVSREATRHTMSSICCPADVIGGALITKEKRQEVYGTVAGGSGSMGPEKYQRAKITEGTGTPCGKTNMRINYRTKVLRDIAQPNKLRDGFDYTEDFDGVQMFGATRVLLNFKSIVGAGGAQTRSLREVYHFVQAQLDVLAAGAAHDTLFANILDGDEAASVLDKFQYLLSLPVHTAHASKIYVGDLKGYFPWIAAQVGK
jgi:hypothetical protein